jgi:hypothetical protein
MNQNDIHDLLKEKFLEIDVDLARKDVLPFIRDKAGVELWSQEFFLSLLTRLQTT